MVEWEMSQGCKFCAARFKEQFWHHDKPKNLSIMAGVELEKKTIGNGKSTIGKAELPQHKPGSPWEHWLPTTSPPHLPALRELYLEKMG